MAAQDICAPSSFVTFLVLFSSSSSPTAQSFIVLSPFYSRHIIPTTFAYCYQRIMDYNANASLDFTDVFDDNEVCSSTKLQEVHRRIIRALGEQWEKIPAEIRGAYGIRFILLNVAFSKSTWKPAGNKLMRDKTLRCHTTAAARGVISAMLWGNERLSQIARWNALLDVWPFLKLINKVDGLLPMTESPRQTETSLQHADRRTQRKRLPKRALAAPPSQLNDVQPAR